MYQNYIFDFNGTLLDDVKVCHDILVILCKEYHVKEVTLQEYIEVFTFPVKEYYRKIGFDVEKDFADIGRKFHDLYDKRSYTEASLYKNVIPVLKKLKEDNKKIICLSASKKETLDKQLKYFGIYDYFNTTLGLDNKDATSKLEIAKNFIRNIKPKDTLLVGDSLHDYEVACSLGVDCVLLTGGHTDTKRLKEQDCLVLNDIIDILNVRK